MGPSELRYLLEDVLRKLEYVIFKYKNINPLNKTKSKETVGFNNVSLIPSRTLIKYFIKLFPYLFADLETLSSFFKVAIVI